MQNKKILFLSFVFFFCLICLSNVCMAKDLDLIHEYTITVDPRKDGTLDMTYHIEWEVLDSTTEGPLEWIKIGIPNEHIDAITTSSKNIKSIRYWEDYGSYIRIDFKKYYKKGETAIIDFKFHTTHMYDLSNGAECKYLFIPGWFDDIKVKNLTVYWKATNVSKHNSIQKKNSDNYLVWKTSLSKGEQYKINVSYPINTFKLDYSKQAEDYQYQYSSPQKDKPQNELLTMIILLIAIAVFSSVASMFTGGGYSSRRGWGYYDDYHYRHRHYNGGLFGSSRGGSLFGSSSKSSSGGGFSCACACACAGGGRAGCSKKDFYGKNLKTAQLNKVLNS